MISREQLNSLAAAADPSPLPQNRPEDNAVFDVEAWLARFGLAVGPPLPWKGGRKWFLEHCPFERSHGGSTTAIIQFPSGAVVLKCQHKDCLERTWQDLQRLHDGGAAVVSASALKPPPANLIRMSDVTPEPVQWLWPGYLPLSEIVIVDGDPGLGKSNLTLELAARISRGLPMPGGSPNALGGPRHVIILSAEDSIGTTIRPRLEAAGADLDRVHALGLRSDDDGLARLPQLPDDIDWIEAAGAEHTPALIIIDPLMAYLSPRTDSFRDQDVRRALAPLKLMAERTATTVLVVRHLNKGGGGNPIYRGGGSIGIVGAARAGLLVAKDPSDESGTRRILAVTKNNLGPAMPSQAFHIEPAGGACRVAWDGPSSLTADALVTTPPRDKGPAGTAFHEAERFLEDTLANGPVPVAEVNAHAALLGISMPTLTRARRSLGVVPKKRGFGEGWLLQLSGEGDHGSPEEDHEPDMIAFGDLDPLLATTAAIPGRPPEEFRIPAGRTAKSSSAEELVTWRG